jgi:hypothetical protein
MDTNQAVVSQFLAKDDRGFVLAFPKTAFAISG